MDCNLMVYILCGIFASFAGAYMAIMHCFSQWDEEDMYDEQDYNDH